MNDFVSVRTKVRRSSGFDARAMDACGGKASPLTIPSNSAALPPKAELMAPFCFHRWVGASVALCCGACGSGSSTTLLPAGNTGVVDGVPGVESATEPALERPEAPRGAATYAPPRPLTPAMSRQIWGGLFGSYQRAAAQTLTVAERERVLTGLEGSGVPRDEVTFVGSNVLVQDIIYGGEPLFAALRASGEGSVEKGKVLAQVVTQVIGVHDTTLVQPGDVVGAPTAYASQPINDQFLFDRPEVDPSFDHVLVLADDVPPEIFDAFVASVAEIGDASGADCLGETFLEVLRRSEFDARFVDRELSIPPRVTEVFYSPEACGGRSLGCTQFPHAEDVVVSAPGADGEAGSVQSRVLVGGFIGINAAAITPESEEFSTLTHEILHALGLAHPVVEAFANGAVAAKLVVPGTLPADGAFPSIMAFRTTTDRTFTLSDDDIDTIRTLYSSAPGCEYQSAPIAVEATEPDVFDAGAPEVDTDASPIGTGLGDAGLGDAGLGAGLGDAGVADAGG